MAAPDPFTRFLELLEIERLAEIARNKLEMEKLPPAVREAMGRSVTKLTAEEEDQVGTGGFPLLALYRAPANEELSPFHAMDAGDLVAAETSTGQRFDGTLYAVEEYRAVIALNGKVPDPLPKGRWSLHAIGSDATYRRMKGALETIRTAQKTPAARLRDVFSGKLKAEVGKTPKVTFHDARLNAGQKLAVAAALAAEDAALIHGPPGTGKTTVLTELVWQAVEAGQRVLVSAPSNIAVDNLLERLLKTDLRVVRLGHPARTLASLRHATLAAQVSAHPSSKKARDLDRARERLMTRRSRRADRGQLSWDERKERQKEIEELWREARELEKAVSWEILDGAQVVLATHGGISRSLGKQKFDLAVLDEASQAVEPMSWIPLLHARKAVFAGDPRQLPPTIHSEEAEKAGLGITLFERLMPILPEKSQVMLKVQYRMNAEIMGFPSKEFYEGELVADASVKTHRLSGLSKVAQNPLTQAPFFFVDTAGTGFWEGWDEALNSRENPEEAALAARILGDILASGVRQDAVALITPYVAQVKRLKAILKDSDVEIGTVDGFQGREKEAVVVSLVRSNEGGEVGFLADPRRLNVALTRARRLLIVIGDSATVGRDPVISRLLDHAEKISAHRSAWEWIEK